MARATGPAVEVVPAVLGEPAEGAGQVALVEHLAGPAGRPSGQKMGRDGAKVPKAVSPASEAASTSLTGRPPSASCIAGLSTPARASRP